METHTGQEGAGGREREGEREGNKKGKGKNGFIYRLDYLYRLSSLTVCVVPSFSRSPWSNKYDPPLEDGAVPSDRLRRLEIEANQAFDTYREL